MRRLTARRATTLLAFGSGFNPIRSFAIVGLSRSPRLCSLRKSGWTLRRIVSSPFATITTVDEWEEEETVRKSRFVARCAQAQTFSHAKSFIERVSDPKARHNCWAWSSTASQRTNDDGEPSGTAGRPILNAIEGNELNNVVVVVTRYKSKDAPMLGAGGLL